jgi:hypothetical protein
VILIGPTADERSRLEAIHTGLELARAKLSGAAAAIRTELEVAAVVELSPLRAIAEAAQARARALGAIPTAATRT